MKSAYEFVAFFRKNNLQLDVADVRARDLEILREVLEKVQREGCRCRERAENDARVAGWNGSHDLETCLQEQILLMIAEAEKGS